MRIQKAPSSRSPPTTKRPMTSAPASSEPSPASSSFHADWIPLSTRVAALRARGPVSAELTFVPARFSATPAPARSRFGLRGASRRSRLGLLARLPRASALLAGLGLVGLGLGFSAALGFSALRFSSSGASGLRFSALRSRRSCLRFALRSRAALLLRVLVGPHGLLLGAALGARGLARPRASRPAAPRRPRPPRRRPRRPRPGSSSESFSAPPHAPLRSPMAVSGGLLCPS